MKNYEELYNEALSRAKDCLEDGTITDTVISYIETIFPELKKSEDEKMKEAIIATIHLYYGEPLEDEAKEMIAWLEKQGGQKPTIEVKEAWKEMRLEVYAQASGNRHQPNCSDNSTKMFSLNDIDEIIECINERTTQRKSALETVKEEKVDNQNCVKSADKSKPFDKYEGLTDFERTLADICICWIGEELGWEQYIKDNADVLLKIAIKKLHSVQDATFEQKPIERKDFISIPFGAYDSELVNETIAIPDGCVAIIEDNKIHIKKEGKTALEAIKEVQVDNANKVETKFKVKYAGSEYNVLEVKDIVGVTFYGIEDEPNHIDYVKAENCEIISSYAIKENGYSYPTKPAVFSEQKTSDNIEQKFNVGDWVVWDNKISCHIDNIYQGKESLMYAITDVHNMTRSYSVKCFDNNAHIWDITKDAKDGDVLATGQVVFIFKKIHGVWLNCHCSAHKDGSFFADSYDLLSDKYFGEVYPATKEQRDTLFANMKDAEYGWDAGKKELFKLNKSNQSNAQSNGIWHTANEVPAKDNERVFVEFEVPIEGSEPMEVGVFHELLYYSPDRKGFYFSDFFISKDEILRWAYIKDLIK